MLFMNTSPNGSGPGASPAKFAHWQRQTSVMQDVAAFRNVTVNYTGRRCARAGELGQVSAPFFRLLGAHDADRPHVLCRGGSAERSARRRAFVRMVDAPLRVRSERSSARRSR